MSNPELSFLLKEIISIKQQIAENAAEQNGFIKNLISIAPASITSAATIFGVWWAFKRTFKKELLFQEKKDKKELHEKLVSIYGQIVGYNYTMMSVYMGINNTVINGRFINSLSLIEKDKDTINELNSKYYKCVDETDRQIEKLIVIQEKYTNALSQYLCYFPNTEVFLLYAKISRNYLYEHTRDYTVVKTRPEFEAIREEMIKGSEAHIHNTYSFKLKEIGDTILKETGIKKV